MPATRKWVASTKQGKGCLGTPESQGKTKVLGKIWHIQLKFRNTLVYKVQSSKSLSQIKAIQKLKRFLNMSAIMDKLSCYYAEWHRKQV